MEDDILMLTSGLQGTYMGTQHTVIHIHEHILHTYTQACTNTWVLANHSPAPMQQLAARFPTWSPWTLPKVLLTWPQLGPKPHLTCTPLTWTYKPVSPSLVSSQVFAVASSHMEWTANSQDSPFVARLKLTIHSKILNRKVDSPQGN